MTTPAPHPLSQELAHILGQPVLTPQNHTDLGNARRLVELHGEDFRYCVDRVFFWMETRWVPEVTGRMHQFAEHVILSLYAEATLLEAEAATNPGLTSAMRQRLSADAEATSKWARQSENHARIKAMIALAQMQQQVQIDSNVWDSDPMLLNCQNGTLNLQTNILAAHARGDYLTRITAAAYDPSASYQAWDDFLTRVVPDDALRAYLHRALGYSITGLTVEEKLFMPWGPPATGKSTLFRAVITALGDYAAMAGSETFGEQRADANTPRTDIARLAGKRLVLAMELSGNQKLATSLLKQMTGGDIMVARHLYHELFEFVPSAKIWLASNSRPVISDDDPGIWRRVSQVPFLEEIPELERDPGLKLALMDVQVAGPAVLRWLADGCAAWRALGLGTPQVVLDASTAYREDMDKLADFIIDMCIVQEGAACTNPSIWRAYQHWVQTTGERDPLGRKSFSQRLQAKGFTTGAIHRLRVWHGIELAAEGYHQEDLL